MYAHGIGTIQAPTSSKPVKAPEPHSQAKEQASSTPRPTSGRRVHGRAGPSGTAGGPKDYAFERFQRGVVKTWNKIESSEQVQKLKGQALDSLSDLAEATKSGVEEKTEKALEEVRAAFKAWSYATKPVKVPELPSQAKEQASSTPVKAPEPTSQAKEQASSTPAKEPTSQAKEQASSAPVKAPEPTSLAKEQASSAPVREPTSQAKEQASSTPVKAPEPTSQAKEQASSTPAKAPEAQTPMKVVTKADIELAQKRLQLQQWAAQSLTREGSDMAPAAIARAQATEATYFALRAQMDGQEAEARLKASVGLAPPKAKEAKEAPAKEAKEALAKEAKEEPAKEAPAEAKEAPAEAKVAPVPTPSQTRQPLHATRKPLHPQAEEAVAKEKAAAQSVCAPAAAAAVAAPSAAATADVAAKKGSVEPVSGAPKPVAVPAAPASPAAAATPARAAAAAAADLPKAKKVTEQKAKEAEMNAAKARLERGIRVDGAARAKQGRSGSLLGSLRHFLTGRPARAQATEAQAPSRRGADVPVVASQVPKKEEKEEEEEVLARASSPASDEAFSAP